MRDKLELLTGTLFTVTDVADVFLISEASARVLCTRYYRRGEFIRLRKNLYVLREDWNRPIDVLRFQFEIANHIQVPSYVSLMTALGWFNITTQMQHGVVESVAGKRSYVRVVENITFRYFCINRNLYFGFRRQENLFIASPEKALADCIYLSSLGRYAIDMASIDWGAIEKTLLDETLARFPLRTRKWWKKYEPF